MSTALITRARNNYRMAELMWRECATDDSYINETCKALNESLEYSLKYIMELNGVKAVHTHVIQKLLPEVPTQYASTEWYSILRGIATEIKDWYSEARYADNFVALRDTTLQCFRAAKLLLDEIENNVKHVCTVEDTVAQILAKLHSDVDVKRVMKLMPSVDLPYEILFETVKAALQEISKE